VLARFLFYLLGGFAISVIVEDYVRTRLCEELHRCGSNAARTPGYECGFSSK
jgi:hypothetical protein